MKKILKAFGACILSLTLITSVFGCKKSTTTKKGTTSNTTSDTKVTSNTPTTTNKPTTTKKTVPLDPKEQKTIHITDYENVTIKGNDGTKEYLNNDTFEIGNILNFACKNDNNYPVLVNFYSYNDYLLKTIKVGENETKDVQIKEAGDIYIKTEKIDVDSSKAFINIDQNYDVSYEIKFITNSEGAYSYTYGKNGGQYDKGNLVSLSITNWEYMTLIMTLKVGDNVIDEKVVKKESSFGVNDLVLSDDVSVIITKYDYQFIEIADFADCILTAYYYDENNQKIVHNGDFDVKTGTKIYFEVDPQNEFDAVIFVTDDREYKHCIAKGIIKKGTTGTIKIGNGFIATSSLCFFSKRKELKAVNFASEVEGVSLELIDLDTQELLEINKECIESGSNIRFKFTNTSNQKAIIKYGDFWEEYYLLDGESLFFDRTLDSSTDMTVQKYSEHKFELEKPDDDDIQVVYYYHDHNGASYNYISGDYYYDGIECHYNITNNSKRCISLIKYNALGEELSNKIIYPGRIETYTGFADIESDFKIVIDYVGSEITYNNIKVESYISSFDCGFVYKIHNGMDKFVDENGFLAVHGGTISMDLQTQGPTVIKYQVTDSNNNIVKEGYCGNSKFDGNNRINKKIEIYVSDNLKIKIEKVEEEIKHTISWDNPSNAPFYVKYEDYDDIEDVSGSPAMFINDTKMIISVGNDFGEDDIVNVEIQFADGTIQSFSVAYGEEVEKQFYLDQDTRIVIEKPDE